MKNSKNLLTIGATLICACAMTSCGGSDVGTIKDTNKSIISEAESARSAEPASLPD